MYIYIYIYDFRQKNPTTKIEIELSLLYLGRDSRHRMRSFGFAGIRKVPEGFRKLVRKLTLFFQHHRSSGRFRKISGSLSGSLFLFRLCFCRSGRFRKVPGSLSGSLFEHIGLLHSGRFRKVSGSLAGRDIKYQMIVLGVVSLASLQSSISCDK